MSSESPGGELPPALSFSELRERIDGDVASSGFNYHLRQLLGTFVERRENGSAQLIDGFVTDESGYALRPEGTLVTRVLRAITTTGRTERAPFPTGVARHYCGTETTATYRNRIFAVECPDCDHLYVHTLVPPGVIAGETIGTPDGGVTRTWPDGDDGRSDPTGDERACEPDDRALSGRANTYVRTKAEAFARGSRPLCANPAEPTVIDPETVNRPAADRIPAFVRRRCDRCGNLNSASIPIELLVDPGVVAFRYDHGIDLTTRLLWDVPYPADRNATILPNDPWRARVTITLDDETLRVVVDEHLRVRERPRE